jgi:hypothetical protein
MTVFSRRCGSTLTVGAVTLTKADNDDDDDDDDEDDNDDITVTAGVEGITATGAEEETR